MLAALVGWGAQLQRLSDPALLPGGFSSDSAVPLLMANDETLGIESLYYWGQDRFGGLPFALGQLVHRSFGLFWAPEAWALVQGVWVALSALVVLAWVRRVEVAALWALALLVGPWREVLFDISQPYAWQLTLTVLALWLLERSIAGPAARAGSTPAPPGARISVWLGGFAFLASWANSMSGLWLLGLALVELARGRVPRRSVATRALLPVVLGVALEAAVRGVVQLHYRSAHGFSAATSMSLRPSGAMEAFGLAFEAVHPLWLLAALAIAVAALFVKRVPRYAGWLAACAAANVLLPPLVKHVQENGVLPRYFTVGAVFMPFVLAALSTHVHRLTALFGAVALTLAGPLCAPPVPRDEGLARARAVASRLAALRPGAFISSGYWETYRLAALVPNHQLQPVPRHSQYARTPQLYDALARSSAVWLGSGGAEDPANHWRLELHPHVLVGRSLLVPHEDAMQFNEGDLAFTLYRPLPTAYRTGEACPDRPLVLEVSAGTTVLAAWSHHDLELSVDGLDGHREGPLWVWPLNGVGGHAVLRTVGDCGKVVALLAAERSR